MGKNSITKKQHYIPQVYLKGFQVEKGLIYQYKKEMKDNSDRKSVPIKSICQKSVFMKFRISRGNISALTIWNIILDGLKTILMIM